MILGEVFPGEDAEVLVEAIKADFSGEDEDTIQDLAVWVKHYKETEVQATGATAVWNSNMGQYLITIPAAYVPASGIFDICVKGSDIEDILIRLQVNTGDDALTSIETKMDAAIALVSSVGAEKVIPPDYYTLDAEAKTITLKSPYNTITVEQLKFIKDIDANYIIYDDREKSYEELPISIADGVLTYTTPAQNTVAGNVIQISINM